MSTSKLELADIQGNILTAYGRLGFPKARYLLFHIGDASAGRAFVQALHRRVTTALRWPSARPRKVAIQSTMTRPLVTINLAFTFRGLLALGLPVRTLRGMPDDFIDGMAARAAILGDDVLDNTPDFWDPVWRADRPSVHVLVALNAQAGDDGGAVPQLTGTTAEILALADRLNAAAPGALLLLDGHRGASSRWQELSALMRDRQPTPFEHFGYMDAIGDPIFLGQYPEGEECHLAVGQGAVDGQGHWRPLATGEFVLGWSDEAQEVAGAAMPPDFSRNGSFFSYRKLHQHVEAFEGWIDDTAARLAVAWKIDDAEDARATLKAKMAGRWTDGVPLTAAPDIASWKAFNARFAPDSKERARALVEFRYGDDRDGTRCPMTSHMRRMNTRDALDPRALAAPADRMGSALNNRRRVLRRGLPYGSHDAPDGEHGIVMLCHCASLSRQFEFVQQQ